MEYFTLSEDLEEIRSSKGKVRNRIIGCLSVVVLLFLLRGSGLLTVEYNQAYLDGNHRISKEFYEFYNDGNASQNNKNSKLTTDDEIFSRDLGLSTKASNFSQDEKVYLEKMVKEKILTENALSRRFESSVISVEQLQTSGGYWLPLVKKGQSSYRILVENRHFQDRYAADFTGEIDFEVYGICTADKLNRIIADKIAQTVVGSIKEDYKK